MISKKLVGLATTALVGNVFVAAAAFGQSTATTALDTVVITGSAGPQDIAGIQAETVAKTRTTINQDFIETQAPGQTILQTLQVVTPGLNFTNNDPYGTSGGNIRLHGFDGNRVALTFDGMPLNDSGNYAVFTNQLLDSELISTAQVNTGSTDVDSPTAASTGGTIAFSSRNPSDHFGGFVSGAVGDFNYKRVIGLVDTGEFGPWGTKAWVAASYQNYDKFKGKGELEKSQYNAKIYQPIGDGADFVSVAFHWNRNRNNAYFGPNLRTINGLTGAVTPAQYESDPRGYEFDFNPTYSPIVTTTRAGFAGDIDIDPAANSNYYALRINPSDTGNIRGQSRFDFGDNLTLTVDPSFQYVLANGGTQNLLVFESCNGSTTSNTTANCPVLTRQLLGTAVPGAVGAGVDLNGDGDANDQARVMNPSTTNTRRIGLLSSLIWKFAPDQVFRIGYTYDRARHRQTGEFSFVNPTTMTYASPFGGKDGWGKKIITADGKSFLRNRDRFSIAALNQVAAEYRGEFGDLSINIGVRAPYFERELNQYCYSQNGSSFVRCTNETPNATLANGNVTFAGAATQYIEPFAKKVKFDDLLPNIGAAYKLGDGQLYGSYAESTSLPRTDNLYTPFRNATATTVQQIVLTNVQPETSKTWEGGYRYNHGDVIASLSGWHTDFENRIVNSFDQDLGISIDRNVGKVKQWGVDGTVAWSPVEELSAYFTASYNDSEVQSDLKLNGTATGTAPTKGKELVETPKWSWSSRIEWKPMTWLTFGGDVKFVGERWVTDVNDLKVDAYTITNVDAAIKLDDLGWKGSSIRLNVINLFDVDYLGSLGTQTASVSTTAGSGTPFANIGSPRTFTASLRVGF